jgi:hypothetical protein
MASPPRTRRFFRPLLEDIRRIVSSWKQRCGSSVRDFPEPTREWTIDSPIRHTVRFTYSRLSGRGLLSVDGIVVFERCSPLCDLGATHEVEIDGVPYSLIPQSDGSSDFIRTGTEEEKVKRQSSNNRILAFSALCIAMGVYGLAVPAAEHSAASQSDHVLGYVFAGLYFPLALLLAAIWFKRSGWFRHVRRSSKHASRHRRIGRTIALPIMKSFCLALGAYLFARAYGSPPGTMFLSIAGAVASFSVAICCAVMWLRLLGWWRRVPDSDVPVKTTGGTRPRSRTVCRRLLEDIHRTAATR